MNPSANGPGTLDVPSNIKIGILTALPIECAAVRLMLTEEVEYTAPGEGGGRSYYLGRIPAKAGGSHLVAVALLPDMGNNSAAISAMRLLHHFVNVKHIIMCGIAGGVPKPGVPEHDVRLGDIVVSNRNGVVQYDLVKEQPNGSREHRPPPRPPDPELLDAVRHLRTEEELDRRPWETLFRLNDTRPRWRRPEDNVDARGERVAYPYDGDRRPGLPRVFAATIAAANILLKNSAYRDYLSECFGVKAIEMEGSGIADATWFDRAGYLVVRGICDYCDGDKGDVWQRTAAFAAAAYTRALLSCLYGDPPAPTKATDEGIQSDDREAIPSVPSDSNRVSDVARLETAYSRREQIMISGGETEGINAEILEIRRQLRRGPSLQEGDFLADGRFRLVTKVGRGGFATVWKAYDRKERQLVAVKVLHGQFAQEPNRRERLFRGSRKMEELRHPYVARVLVPEEEDQGFYFYVMEYAHGGDLYRAILNQRLDVQGALEVISMVSDSLSEAHSKGLVHRDVKPHNILLRANGTPALADFDLVQARDTTGGTQTAAMGTFMFCAPEQHQDASRVDHRADIFGLAMTAVFCIYGKPLPIEAMYQRDAFFSRLPCAPSLRAVLSRAAAVRVEDRFQSMQEFQQSLLAISIFDAGDSYMVDSPNDERIVTHSPAALLSPRTSIQLLDPSELIVTSDGVKIDDPQRLLPRLSRLLRQDISFRTLMSIDPLWLGQQIGFGEIHVSSLVSIQHAIMVAYPAVDWQWREPILQFEDNASGFPDFPVHINYALLTAEERKSLRKVSITVGRNPSVRYLMSSDIEDIAFLPGIGRKTIRSLHGLRGRIREALEQMANGQVGSLERRLVVPEKPGLFRLPDLDIALYEDLDLYFTNLDEEKRGIIQARRGWKTRQRTLSDLGQELRLSRERVRQIESSALCELPIHLRVHSNVILGLIVDRDPDVLISELPTVAKQFHKRSLFLEILERCAGKFPGEVFRVRTYEPPLPASSVDDYFAETAAPVPRPVLVEHLEAEYRVAVAEIQEYIDWLEEQSRIRTSGSSVWPCALTRHQAIAHVLADHPDGLSWRQVVEIANEKGCAKVNLDPHRLAGFHDAPRVYLCEIGRYRHLKFLKIDASDISEVLGLICAYLKDRKVDKANLRTIFDDMNDQFRFGYFEVRHIASAFGLSAGFRFAGTSRADMVTVDSSIGSPNPN